MSNILLSLPWINHPILNKTYGEIFASEFSAEKVYLLSNHNSDYYNDLDNCLELILVTRLINKYLDCNSELIFNFQNREDFFKYRYNLAKILDRWTRTYSLNSDFTNIDYVSSLVINYWSEFITNSDIKLIITHYPHTPHDYTIYFLGKLLNIKVLVLIPFFNPLSNIIRYLISSDLTWDKKIRFTSTFDLDYDLKLILNSFKENRIEKNIMIIDSNYSIDTYISRKSFKFGSNIIRRFYSNIIKYIKLKNNIIKDKNILNYVTSIEQDFSYHDKYVYFPLHYQPEASTIPAGNYYSDQMQAIRLLSSRLPKGVLLYVKEHPAYWDLIKNVKLRHYTPFTKHRSKSIYAELSNIQNVKLISHNISSEELIRNSLGVSSITGSVLIESMILGKPALQFGEHHYLNLPNVYNASIDKDFDEFISTVLDITSYKIEDSKILDLLLLIQHNSIENVQLDFDNNSYTNNIINKEISYKLKEYLSLNK